jgi:hypothetical protein
VGRSRTNCDPNRLTPDEIKDGQKEGPTGNVFMGWGAGTQGGEAVTGVRVWGMRWVGVCGWGVSNEDYMG